jgi:hypothetical protein
MVGLGSKAPPAARTVKGSKVRTKRTVKPIRRILLFHETMQAGVWQSFFARMWKGVQDRILPTKLEYGAQGGKVLLALTMDLEK